MQKVDQSQVVIWVDLGIINIISINIITMILMIKYIIIIIIKRAGHRQHFLKDANLLLSLVGLLSSKL